ncbi:hypothetical protein Nepgr_000498 [Nepenthes gracilis]|uniref:Uncharacterized protein n=1 Tax=Nepenthes gracilis TaxID=150966 RepID=A0AAD3P6I0_NEPGR|nr:hypothetical protein Nepgr_000498 [Nepenthes gracilis]
MGDGGVACMPLHHIMETFLIPENYGGGSSNSNGKLGSKSVKMTGTKRMKLKRDAFFKKEPEKSELRSVKVKSSKEVENAEDGGEMVQKEEVEEGELGTLKSPKEGAVNGELSSEKFQRGITEKGDIVPARLRKGEVDKAEFVLAKWRKGEVEKVKFSSGRSRSDVVARRERSPEKYRKGYHEKAEFGSWRGAKNDIEKGEFIPDRLHRGEYLRDDYKSRGRHDSSRGAEWRSEREWTPPGKYSGGEFSPGKESRKIGSQHSKRSARSEAHQERNYPKLSSKIVDEVGSYKSEHIHGKNHDREHSSGSRLMRHGTYSDRSGRKHYDDHANYGSSKSRRLSGDSCRSTHTEHHSHRFTERSYRNSSSRVDSERHSSRRYDSYSSRSGGDRYGHSPSHSERSPHERVHYRDHRDRTPVRRERSPHDHGHHFDHRTRSPSNAIQSPENRSRPHECQNRSPSYLEQSPRDWSRRNEDRETSRQSEVSDTKLIHDVLEEELSDRDPNQGVQMSQLKSLKIGKIRLMDLLRKISLIRLT